jgi:hypothetical protein
MFEITNEGYVAIEMMEQFVCDASISSGDQFSLRVKYEQRAGPYLPGHRLVTRRYITCPERVYSSAKALPNLRRADLKIDRFEERPGFTSRSRH